MPSHSDLWLTHALLYRERFGFSILPMGEEKKPLIKWAELQTRRPTVNEILSWPRGNLGIVTGEISGVCVIDCESPENARWFYDNRFRSGSNQSGSNSGQPAIVQTKRGFHFYFRHPGQRVANASHVLDEAGVSRYDVRGDGGYILAPPSTHSEGSYSWINAGGGIISAGVSSLPVFDLSWRPTYETVYREVETRIGDALAYITKILAVSGQNGHADTYRAACILYESGLHESEALIALQDWNKTNANPPWNDRDLLHKVRSAYSSGDNSQGTA